MSSIYYKNQKYTGPTLDLGSGSLTTDDKTIVGAINELDAEVGGLVESGASYCKIGNTLICYGMIGGTLSTGESKEETVTFPKAFSASPVIIVSPLTQGDYDFDFVYVKSRGANSSIITLVNKYTGNNSVYAMWVAIGVAG